MSKKPASNRNPVFALLIALLSTLFSVLPASAAYSDYRISAGPSNTVVAGQPFTLTITVTCDTAMSLNSSPYYPSMYYLVWSNPWLNNYISAQPTLTNNNKTATWNVPLTAPATPGTYDMEAYGRSTVCFNSPNNFVYTPRTPLQVVTGPVISSSLPSSGATAVATNTPLTITYHEPINVLSGNFYLRKFSDDSIVQTFDVTSLTVSGSTLDFGNLAGISSGTKYYLTADAGVVESVANGNDSTALLKSSNISFTTSVNDTTAPALTSTTPVNGATVTAPPNSITLGFSEAVSSAGTGSMEVREGETGNLVAAMSISQAVISGANAAFALTSSLSYSTSYYVLIPTGSFVDTSPNANQFAGLTSPASFSFSVGPPPDLTAPILLSATTDSLGRTILLNLDESISTSGSISVNRFAIEVDGSPRTVSAVSVSASQVSLTLFGRAISSAQTVTVAYTDPTTGDDANVLQDNSGNDVASFSSVVTNGSTWDGLRASILSVQGISADGSYRQGATISIKVVFSNQVSVSGQPQLLIETGSTDQAATYQSGTGTSELIFSFVVSSSSETQDMNYSSTASLTLAGGAINNLSLDPADLTLPNLDSAQSLGSLSNIRLDNTAPVITLSAVSNVSSTNNPKFRVLATEDLNCSSLSTSPGVDFAFGGFSSILSVSTISNGCELTIATNVSAGSQATFSISAAVGFALEDIAGNAALSLSGVASVVVNIPTPTPVGASVAPSFTNWVVSAGQQNSVRPGESFELRISITCNQEMSTNSAPFYPSMYYMVNSNPWLNGYLSTPPVLSADRRTAVWTVNLVAPTTPGNYQMYAYARGQVCFGDSFNFNYSSREMLAVTNSAVSTTSPAPPSSSQTSSPVTTPGYSDWSLSMLSQGTVNPRSTIQLQVSMTCNVPMRVDQAPYFPSMYYFLNGNPRVNGVYGRPDLSEDGRTATWRVSVLAPATPGRYVFQAYGRDNPTGGTCFGSSSRFTYSRGTIVEVLPESASPQSESQVATAGFSSWRLSATGNPDIVEGGELRLNVSLTCNVRMSAASAPFFPSMYYLVNSPQRINGIFGSPSLSEDGLTARWTVTVPAPTAGTYSFNAYGRDNPSGKTCFGDSLNFAYSSNFTITVQAPVILTPSTPSASPSQEPTPQPNEPTQSPAATPTPSPSAAASPTSEPESTPIASSTAQPTSPPIQIMVVPTPGVLSIQNEAIAVPRSFLNEIVDSLGQSVVFSEDDLVRVRVGDSEWQELSIGEVRAESEKLLLKVDSNDASSIEVEVVTADGSAVLGVATFAMDITDGQVVLSQPQSEAVAPIWLILFALLGISILLMLAIRYLRGGEASSS